MKRTKPLTQVYSQYTAEDFSVWKILFNRQMKVLQATACKDYLRAVDDIGFTAEEIPHFETLNQRLASLTGWKIVTVAGICPPKDFFALLAQKTFTCTCWLRSMQELDYLEEPDMFHDVFGHVPLLTNEKYCSFFQQLGLLALQHLDDDVAIDMLERLYWFTIEFGLMQEGEELKIYGSGIISSIGETQHALSTNSAKHFFDAQQIMQHPFRTDVLQTDYFVIQNFEQLQQSIPLVSRLIKAAAMTFEKVDR